jgi:hypothetical protein
MTERETAAGWEDHDQAQRRAWLRLTSRQRLDWLWEARQFALRAASAKLSNRASGAGPQPAGPGQEP